MAPDSPIGGHDAMEPQNHRRAMEGHRMPQMAIGAHEWPRLVFTFQASIWKQVITKTFKKYLQILAFKKYIFSKFISNRVFFYLMVEFFIRSIISVKQMFKNNYSLKYLKSKLTLVCGNLRLNRYKSAFFIKSPLFTI